MPSSEGAVKYRCAACLETLSEEQRGSDECPHCDRDLIEEAAVPMTDGGSEDNVRYRAFCVFDHRGRAPGCGWEGYAETEAGAERLVEKHEEGRCVADYERELLTEADR